MTSKISYTLKITVIQLRRPLWRRLLVPSDIKLPRLHSVIQIVTGAGASPAHFFIDSQKTVYADPDCDDLPRVRSGRDVSLARLLKRPGDRLAYYSGDDHEWEHSVELLRISYNASRLRRARCLAGNGPIKDARRNRGFPLAVMNRALHQVRV